jgi:hypothetical protein
MIKKTNLCASGFQRPHTLEKACLSEIMMKSKAFLFQTKSIIPLLSKEVSQSHYVMIYLLSFEPNMLKSILNLSSSYHY